MDNGLENLLVFQDCLSTSLIERLAPSSARNAKRRVKRRRNEIKPVSLPVEPESDAADLSDFIEVIVLVLA